MKREVVWSAWEGPGLEHARLQAAGGGGSADGVVIGVADDAPLRLRYQVRWDAAWRTRQVRVSRLDAAGWDLELSADGEGKWVGADGRPIPALDGCLDVDLMATPFTNTLPIRRLDLRTGQSADVRVVYIAVPDLDATAELQRYVALSAGRHYRFEASDGEYVAELTVDDDGLVVEYPGLFRRVASVDKMTPPSPAG